MSGCSEFQGMMFAREFSSTAVTPPVKPLRLALAGFGTVGQSVARLLSGAPAGPLRLTHICNRRVERKKVDWIAPDVCWTDRIDEALSPDVDVLVELIGGVSPAREWVERALLAGKSVVTANKQLIAHAGAELMTLAGRQGCQLRFEAAVAGGIPVIGALQDGLAGDRLFRILGILNGTCNYILTRMETARLPFSDALREAQERGYAEADPSADVDGFDAQAKLAILCGVGLGRLVHVSDIPCRSIASVEPIDFVYAERLGSVIRQISWAEEIGAAAEAIRASVQPVLVPRSSPLARIQGSQNMVVAFGEFGGETAFSGHGAGGNPTAVAVVSDLLAVARNQGGRQVRFPTAGGIAGVDSDFVTPQYVRFTVRDRPGIIAALAGGLSAHGINIDAVLQEPGFSKSSLPFVVTLEPCGGAALHAALKHIEALDFHVRPPVCLPILTLGQAEAGTRRSEGQ